MTITVKLYRKGPIKRRANGSRHATIEYAVRSDSLSEDMDAIADNASLPEQHVDAHPDNAALICREVETDEWEQSSYQYIVTAHFDTEVGSASEDEDYTTAPVIGSMSIYTEDRPALTDAEGNPLTNGADDYYEGQTRRHRMIKYDCEAKFAAHPNSLKNLVGTLNNGDITIHGETYPAGTALMLGLDAPKRPDYDASGAKYWTGGYPVLIDLDGWILILPNRGLREYVYQTRASTTADWEDSGFAAYDAESDGTLKRKIKVRIVDDQNTEIPESGWLNNNGEAITGSLELEAGTGNTTAGSTTLSSITGPTLTTADDAGKYIQIAGAGLGGRTLRTRIVTASAGSAVLADAAITAVTGAAITIGGIFCQRFRMDDLADWSSLPLPNNQ